VRDGTGNKREMSRFLKIKEKNEGGMFEIFCDHDCVNNHMIVSFLKLLIDQFISFHNNLDI
jgi:hypothetical protein